MYSRLFQLKCRKSQKTRQSTLQEINGFGRGSLRNLLRDQNTIKQAFWGPWSFLRGDFLNPLFVLNVEWWVFYLLPRKARCDSKIANHFAAAMPWCTQVCYTAALLLLWAVAYLGFLLVFDFNEYTVIVENQVCKDMLFSSKNRLRISQNSLALTVRQK